MKIYEKKIKGKKLRGESENKNYGKPETATANGN